MKEKIVAIVPAAGLGQRFGTDKNKPFYRLLDRPLIVWSLQILQELDEIREIVPVLKEADMDEGREIFESYNLSKIRRIVPGGRERQDSVYNGLKVVDGKADIVVIHDGARPLVDADIVRRTLKGISGFEGAVAGVPVKDTIKEVSGALVKKTLKRDAIWAVQTPQVFLYRPIMKAYHTAMEAKFYSTDDSALIERSGGKVKMVEGSYSNIKITTPEDIPVAELLLSKRTKGGA